MEKDLLKSQNSVHGRKMQGDNASSAANQQGTQRFQAGKDPESVGGSTFSTPLTRKGETPERTGPSETIRRAPFSVKEAKAYLLGALHDGTFSSNQRFRISQKGKNWLMAS